MIGAAAVYLFVQANIVRSSYYRLLQPKKKTVYPAKIRLLLQAYWLIIRGCGHFLDSHTQAVCPVTICTRDRTPFYKKRSTHTA